MHEPRVGVDLVDVPAFEARFRSHEDGLAEVFTDAELSYCRRQRRPWAHLAARFAAKEAVFKALQTGLTGTMRWRDVEIVRDPAGAPSLNVTGVVGEMLRKNGLSAGSVSISHTPTHAIAIVMLVCA